MNNIKSFHELLEHYRFTDAVPAPFRKSALKSQKRLLKKILKEVDEYTLFFGLCLTVLFFLSRTGLKLSIGGAKIVTISLLAVGVTLPASYTTVQVHQYYQESRFGAEEKTGETALLKDESNRSVIEKSRNRKINSITNPGAHTISFRGLRFIGGDQALTREFSGILKAELEDILKARKLLSLAAASRRGDFALVGSIREKTAGYFVSLRIVAVKSGEIVKGEYFTVKTSEDFTSACRAAVEKLVIKIEEETKQE